jgi:Predicted permeases
MNIITWYIFRQLLGPLVFITLTLTAVVWLTQSLRFLDLMISRGISAGTLAYLTLLLLPNFFVIILPIALFCAVLFVYYKLETDSELVVMKSTGLSEYNLIKPTLLLSIIITMLLFSLTLFFQPLGFREFKDKQFAFRHNLAPVLGQEGAFNIIVPRSYSFC